MFIWVLFVNVISTYQVLFVGLICRSNLKVLYAGVISWSYLQVLFVGLIGRSCRRYYVQFLFFGLVVDLIFWSCCRSYLQVLLKILFVGLVVDLICRSNRYSHQSVLLLICLRNFSFLHLQIYFFRESPTPNFLIITFQNFVHFVQKYFSPKKICIHFRTLNSFLIRVSASLSKKTS